MDELQPSANPLSLQILHVNHRSGQRASLWVGQKRGIADIWPKLGAAFRLAEDALQYIELLRKAREAAGYYTVDYSKYDTDWSKVYSQRTQLLQKMVKNYNLTVNEKYQDTLNGLMRDANASAKLEAAKKEIEEMTKSFELTSTADEYGYREYSIHMKNTTQYTFDYFDVEISLLDKNGDIVETGSADVVNNWAPGQSANVDAWISNDKDPAEYTVVYHPNYSTADGTIYQ